MRRRGAGNVNYGAETRYTTFSFTMLTSTSLCLCLPRLAFTKWVISVNILHCRERRGKADGRKLLQEQDDKAWQTIGNQPETSWPHHQSVSQYRAQHRALVSFPHSVDRDIRSTNWRAPIHPTVRRSVAMSTAEPSKESVLHLMQTPLSDKPHLMQAPLTAKDMSILAGLQAWLCTANFGNTDSGGKIFDEKLSEK